MSKTFTDVTTEIRVYLDESNQTDFLDTEVARAANAAYHEVVGAVMEVYEDYYFTTTPKHITSVIGQQQYPLDPTLIKLRRVEVNYDPANPNSAPIRAVKVELDELPLNLSNTSVGGSALFNAGYYVIGEQDAQVIGLVPIPQTAGVNAIATWGIAMPVDMVLTTDPVLIPYADRFTFVIALRASARLLRKGQQEIQAADDLDKSYELELLKMKSFLKERKTDGPNVIVDVIMDDITFDYPL